MGKKLREEDLVLNIIVNGDRGRKEINQLERSIIDSRAAISKLAAEQKKLEKQGKADSAQYAANKTAIDRYNASIKTAEERVALLRKGMKLEEMSISDLQKKLAQLTRVRNASIPGSEQWVKASNEIKVIADRLVTLKKKSADTNLSVCKMAEGVNKYVGLLSAGGLSILSMVSGMNRARAAFAEYDDKLSDVMKTTGLTKEETEALSDRLKRINTRTPQLELLDLARVAGKLGLSALEDVEGFVRAADKINVALSEDLGGNAEEALNKVGKLVDIFDLKKKYGIEDAMIRVGSTINELGAASTANEGYVVEFTNRLAGVAPQAGISIENVMDTRYARPVRSAMRNGRYDRFAGADRHVQEAGRVCTNRRHEPVGVQYIVEPRCECGVHYLFAWPQEQRGRHERHDAQFGLAEARRHASDADPRCAGYERRYAR